MKNRCIIFFMMLSLLCSFPTFAYATKNMDQAGVTTSATPTNLANMNILDVLTETKNLSTFLALVKAAELDDMLDGPGLFTMFAPNNAAFLKMHPETMKKIMSDKNKIIAFVKYHLVSGALTTNDIQNGAVRTLEGEMLDIAKNKNVIKINNAKIVQADIITTNGIIYEIDTALMPSLQLTERQVKICKPGTAGDEL